MNEAEIPDNDTLARWRRWHDQQPTTAPSLMERQVEALERISAALEKFHSDKVDAILNDITLMRPRWDSTGNELSGLSDKAVKRIMNFEKSKSFVDNWYPEDEEEE